MKPYEVKYKYNAITATTTIYVNDERYDIIEDYIHSSEKPDLTYTILKQCYAKDAQEELSALRRENQHLKKVIATYEQLNDENE